MNESGYTSSPDDEEQCPFRASKQARQGSLQQLPDIWKLHDVAEARSIFNQQSLTSASETQDYILHKERRRLIKGVQSTTGWCLLYDHECLGILQCCVDFDASAWCWLQRRIHRPSHLGELDGSGCRVDAMLLCSHMLLERLILATEKLWPFFGTDDIALLICLF